MTDLAWTAIRTDTIDRFNGQTPRPEDEAPIIDVFELHPQLVLRAIDETATALAEGRITWAWSVLRSRLERGTTAIREATADTSTERNRRVQNAEAWITNAGIHYDQQSQVEAELFGDDYSRGRLHDYAEDHALRQRLLDHWRTHRPRGEQAERDHLAWSAKCVQDRETIAALAHAKAETQRQETQCTSDPSSTATAGNGPEDSSSAYTTEPSSASSATAVQHETSSSSANDAVDDDNIDFTPTPTGASAT